MNISQALNAAADHIEQNPSSYRFNNATVPRDGEQGCMLGHLGRVAGLPVGLPGRNPGAYRVGATCQ